MNWYRKSRVVEEIDGVDVSSKWIPVDSSFIDAFAYYEPLQRLEVKMKNREYIHNGVPVKVFKEFMASNSKGKFYNEVIKKNYGVK